MNAQALRATVAALVVGDKGLLAMDESNPTCNQRFAALGIPQTEEARRAWREIIVTTRWHGDRRGASGGALQPGRPCAHRTTAPGRWSAMAT